MFRELVRKNKQLPIEECIALLTRETRGVLSVNGDDGYPYGMPMNHFYNPEDSYINEIDRFAKTTILLKLKPEHICGKMVQES